MNKKHSKTLNTLQLALLVAYILFVLWITLFMRSSSGVMRYKSQIFWSYKTMITGPGIGQFKQIVLNIILFMPFGFLIFGFIKGSRALIILVMLAFGFTAFIETYQLVFKVGMFEFDDMFNNTLGAIIGAGIHYSLLQVRGERRIGEVIVGLIPLLVVTMFFSSVFVMKS